MNSLKTMMVVAVMGVVAYGVYATLTKAPQARFPEFSNVLSPDFELEIAVAGILERTGSWVGFVASPAEVIGVDLNRCTIRLPAIHRQGSVFRNANKLNRIVIGERHYERRRCHQCRLVCACWFRSRYPVWQRYEQQDCCHDKQARAPSC